MHETSALLLLLLVQYLDDVAEEETSIQFQIKAIEIEIRVETSIAAYRFVPRIDKP